MKRFAGQRTTLILYVAIALSAALVRIFVALAAPTVFYFPDAWNYITGSMTNWHVYPLHPPTISWLWRIGVLGQYTEKNVLILQSLLGVAEVLLVFSSLLAITRIRWALILSSIFAIVPGQLFEERSFMTYAFEGLLLSLIVRLTIAVATATTRRKATTLFVAVSGVIGVAASIRPGFIFSALVAWLVIGVIWQRSGQFDLRQKGPVAALVGLALLAGLIAPSWLAATNHAQLGVWSPSPVQGTVLVARFAPLVGCEVPKGSTKLVKGSIKEVCGSKFTDPGTMRFEWEPGPLSKTMVTKHNFSRTQSQLLHLAARAFTHHPIAFVGQILNTVWWQVARPPLSDLESNTDGSSWFSGYLLDRGWFSGATSRPANEPIPLEHVTAKTLWLPRAFLWLASVLGIFNFAKRYRRLKNAPSDQSQRFWFQRRLRTMRERSRLAAGAIGTVVIVTSVISVSIGAPPMWSYWIPLLPAIFVLLGLSIPTRTPQDLPA